MGTGFTFAAITIKNFYPPPKPSLLFDFAHIVAKLNK